MAIPKFSGHKHSAKKLNELSKHVGQVAAMRGSSGVEVSRNASGYQIRGVRSQTVAHGITATRIPGQGWGQVDLYEVSSVTNGKTDETVAWADVLPSNDTNQCYIFNQTEVPGTDGAYQISALGYVVQTGQQIPSGAKVICIYDGNYWYVIASDTCPVDSPTGESSPCNYGGD
jgi:hypothetical protein